MFTEEELKNEVWRPISGYEGLYEVSNLGRVRSLPRMRKGRGVGLHRAGGGIIIPIVVGKYLGVQLCNVEQQKKKYIHRLVAEQFLPLVDGKNDINHIDGDKYNNRISNLEWCTPSENGIHAWRMGLHKRGRIPNKKKVLVTYPNGNTEVFDSIAAAAKIIGTDASCVTRLCQRNSTSKKGYKAEFIQ